MIQKNKHAKGMKMALVHPQLLWAGGAEKQLFLLAKNFEKEGHDVSIFTRQYDGAKCYPTLTKNLEIISLKIETDKRHPITEFILKYTLDVIKLRSLIRKHGPFDVVYVQDDPCHWAAAWKNKKHTLLWMCNDPPAWIPYSNQGRAIREAARRFGTAEGRYSKGLFGIVRRMFISCMSKVDNHFTRKTDIITVLDNPNKKTIERWYGERAVVVRAGIDAHKFTTPEGIDVRKKHNIPKDAFLVLCVGLFMPHRRYEDAVHAIEILESRNAHLVIVGSDRVNKPYYDHIKGLVESSSERNRMTLAGYVSDEELPLYYNACDVFIFPNDNQSWGLAPLEAMSSSKPIIVSRGAGISDVLTQGKNAILVNPRSPIQIRDALVTLDGDNKLRERLAKNGRMLVEGLNDVTYAREILRIFKNHDMMQKAKKHERLEHLTGKW